MVSYKKGGRQYCDWPWKLMPDYYDFFGCGPKRFTGENIKVRSFWWKKVFYVFNKRRQPNGANVWAIMFLQKFFIHSTFFHKIEKKFGWNKRYFVAPQIRLVMMIRLKSANHKIAPKFWRFLGFFYYQPSIYNFEILALFIDQFKTM